MYVSCCDAPLCRDVSVLLGAGGFRVESAARFDHFPETSHRGAALLLVRRPPTLLLTVGPAGSGKSTVCRALLQALPEGALRVVERDAVFAERRRANSSGSVARAKRETHAALAESVREAVASEQVCVLDSCNASTSGRNYYWELLEKSQAEGARFRRGDPTARVRRLILSFEPRLGGALATESAAHRDMLLLRVRGRALHRGHPTFPGAEHGDKQERALDLTLSAMEWPRKTEGDLEDEVERAMLLQCGCDASIEQIARLVFAACFWGSRPSI